ncbi:FAD-dependent oxidoreductase [Taibaiella lutea]|uniref:FAD-dependent oxidoreductase n=1 Tax=Taibaiella lutea TaxID=2608001 RepID=A0A5M6CEJ0_9BACT|nr:FAD-dependent oxidoreductase [Taibaiella lutea]KAA5532302.1 FAD-dependent oxidoreductase [Taibaiella lutea]
MIRDSKTLSIWQDVIPFVNLNESPNENDDFDAIIIGAGITGLTTALSLQERGKKCLILEASNIGYGTTSATTAHLNTVLDTPYNAVIKGFGEDNAQLLAQGTKQAIALIKRNIDHYKINCDFEYKDGFLYAENEEQVKDLDDIYDGLQKVGLDVSPVDTIPVPVPFIKAIQFSGQAQFHPVNYLLALTEAFTEKGGIIKEHALVSKVEDKNGTQEVHTPDAVYKAASVVYATHVPPGISILSFKCAPYRTYLLGVTLNDEHQYPEALAYDCEEPYHYFRTVYLDDKKILLVGGNDHKTGHNENTEHIFTELEAYIRKHYDVRTIDYKWSSQYYESADGLPYIGKYPGGNEHLYVATGYGGNGMIFGTLAGHIIADLIITGESAYADLFAPSRLKLMASFKNMVTENADVAKHFIADRLSVEALEEFADLGKEEGRVVKYQEKQIAIYKDEYGVLKALSPVCPHAGCIVSWNSAEKSWDCPCHGARYDTDGQLLNGPSVKPLKKIDIS